MSQLWFFINLDFFLKKRLTNERLFIIFYIESFGKGFYNNTHRRI